MKKAVLVLCAVPFLTMPAFAGSVVIDKPIVVAEGTDIRVKGARVEVGERDRHRDHWNRSHREHAEIVINKRHHHHDRD